jgi:type III restriction enzyme
LIVSILKEKLAEYLVNGIQYEKINEWYEMSQLQESFESWQDYVVPAERCIYDQVECDSEIERKFVQDLKNIDQVLMYIKLPNWFTVPTPVGEYNPDWAIVWEDRDEHGLPSKKPLLYLIRETKSTREKGKLRPDERRKLICGENHFKNTLRLNFDIVTSASQLP